ncbi:hypothetical protein C6502_01260 [Candidatus Poribacteria bacterium]|nr:MAG: hypothetical protein C6502_01260 [Candidatus Poribacteria bacterium]
MEVKIKVRDNVTVLKPDGRLIGVAGREFRRVIQAQLRTASEPPKFLFDFAQVTRMDSTALGVLIGLHVSIAGAGGRIGLINVNQFVHNMLVMARLTTVLERFESETEAIASLQRT